MRTGIFTFTWYEVETYTKNNTWQKKLIDDVFTFCLVSHAHFTDWNVFLLASAEFDNDFINQLLLSIEITCESFKYISHLYLKTYLSHYFFLKILVSKLWSSLNMKTLRMLRGHTMELFWFKNVASYIWLTGAKFHSHIISISRVIKRIVSTPPPLSKAARRMKKHEKISHENLTYWVFC